MIGSQRHTVSLSSYNPNWKSLFEQEKEKIFEEIDQYVVDIQHVGSTSIEGLDAKPIIDIAIAVSSFDEVDEIAHALQKIGYSRLKVKIEGKVIFAKDTHAGRTHYLHIELHNGIHWDEHITFRDYLRSHPEAVTSYMQLKHILAIKYYNDVKSYTEGKREFVDDIIKKAKHTDI